MCQPLSAVQDQKSASAAVLEALKIPSSPDGRGSELVIRVAEAIALP